MRELSDAALAHLCKIAAAPDAAEPRYELAEPIGRGGMGTVFRARDRVLDRTVAVKVLHAAPVDAQARTRMLREARIVARLEHPGIVPVHDAGELPDGRFYCAMKLVRGCRLDEEAARQTSLEERLRLFQKICEAVAFAHAQGVLHRDLKPQNVMVGEFGEVLVMDWGVAKEIGTLSVSTPEENGSASPAPSDTRPGTIVGTPGYMSPEQTRGELDQIDARTDVYGLGGILYFLLTGRPPNKDAKTFSDGLNRSIPRPLKSVCLKALADEPNLRHASVTELAGEVADFLARRRIRSHPEGVVGASLRLAAKYRLVLVLVLSYLIMRVALLVFANSY